MTRELLETTWSMTGRHIVADGGSEYLEPSALETGSGKRTLLQVGR